MLIYLRIAVITNVHPVILPLAIPLPVLEVVLAAFPIRLCLCLCVFAVTAPLSASSSFPPRLPAMKQKVAKG